ncbi:Rib/alpha-like domain-containing protein [Hungatella sp.]
MKSSLNPKRRKMKRAGQKACAFVLSLAIIVPSAELPSYAAVSYRNSSGSISTREMDTTSHFTANGIEESDLRYAGTVFDKIGQDGTIYLTHSKWTKLGQGWDKDDSNRFAGKFILSFSNDEFYKQIDRVILDNINLEKVDDGALWMISIVGSPLKYAQIGSVTNHEIKITLKDGKTLEQLGLAEEKISFNSLWTKSNGAIAQESVSNGFILQDNPNVRNEQETGFTTGRMSQKLIFDAESMSIKSVHSFKPNENFLQSDYGWVVYIKEQMPAELAQYIDKDEIYIYASDITGEANIVKEKIKVNIDETGMVDTSTVPELSIVNNDTKDQLAVARRNLDRIFYGTLGSSRQYTISYKLRDDVTLEQFARELNEYVKTEKKRVLFEHWLEADYLNESNQTLIHKPDGGAAPKQLTNSYSNAYLDTNDTDQDGLFDFVEWQIGTDAQKVDTDGDGVPDGKEFMEDETKPNDAKDYLVSVPTLDTTSFDPTKETTISGKVEKPLQKDPSDATKLLDITNQDAGDTVVKLQEYDEASKTYTQEEYGTTKIPFADLQTGNFTITVPANTVPEGKKVVLVAYSPNGENPAMGTPFEFKQGDAEKYEATGGTLDKKYGETATADEIKGKVTTTAPENKVKTKEVVGDIPTTGKNQKVKVKVTYSDDTFDEVEVTLNYGTAAEKYTPVGQGVTVEKGGTPEAAGGIKNKTDLPTGTTYEWKKPVDTTKPGTQKGTVVVTYPDKSRDEVEVDVQVKETKTDAQTYEATGGTLDKAYGETATADEIKGKVTTTAPDNKVKSKTVVGAIPTTGKNQKVKVKVTYADDSFDEVEVTLNYGTAADKYAPVGQEVPVEKGGTPEASEGIKNKTDLPTGTTYEWKKPVDTTKPGTQKGTIVVTYPDKSTDEIEVNVRVTDTKTDAQTYEATGGTLDKAYGETATADEIKGKVTTTAPDNKVKSKTVVGAIPTTGKNQKVTVKVTYADDSFDEVEVTVNYGTAADKYDPEVEKEIVKPGGKVELTDNVTNLDELPEGTKVKDVTENPIDTSKPGEHTGKLEITYPDGSKETIEVPVTVVDKTDAERYKPLTKRELIEQGQTYDLTDNVKNIGNLPAGTTVEDVTPEGDINVEEPGNYTGIIKVMYPDGSSETAKVKVKVKKKKPDAEKYDPEVVPEIIYVGELSDLSDNVVNLEDELPEGTVVTDITEYGEDGVNLDRPGKYKGRIEIEYPDGSIKELTVPIRVLKDGTTATPSEAGKATPSEPGKATGSEAEKTDASKYEPKPNPIVVDQGGTFEPGDAIKNKDELPNGTDYRDETPDNVDKTKDYTAIIIVTYPDGSEDKVKVPVTVKPGTSNPGKPSGSGGSSSGGASRGSGSSGRNVSNDRIYANPDMSVSTGSIRGTWTLVDAQAHQWTYTTSSGVMAKNGWMFIGNPYAKDEEGRFSWFKFDANGIMEFGWIKSQNGKWYHTHAVSDGNLGILHKGWYHEPMDGKWYYLDEKTGVMLDGWVSLSGKYYYFTEAPLVPEQTYFQRENGYWYYDNHSRRPYGSMYQNEMTPDNYFVDQNGVWDGRKH